MKWLLAAILALGLSSTSFAGNYHNNVVVERIIVERRPQVKLRIVSPHRQVSFLEVRDVEIVRVVDRYGRVRVLERVVVRDYDNERRFVRERIVVENHVNRLRAIRFGIHVGY